MPDQQTTKKYSRTHLHHRKDTTHQNSHNQKKTDSQQKTTDSQQKTTDNSPTHTPNKTTIGVRTESPYVPQPFDPLDYQTPDIYIPTIIATPPQPKQLTTLDPETPDNIPIPNSNIPTVIPQFTTPQQPQQLTTLDTVTPDIIPITKVFKIAYSMQIYKKNCV